MVLKNPQALKWEFRKKLKMDKNTFFKDAKWVQILTIFSRASFPRATSKPATASSNSYPRLTTRTRDTQPEICDLRFTTISRTLKLWMHFRLLSFFLSLLFLSFSLSFFFSCYCCLLFCYLYFCHPLNSHLNVIVLSSTMQTMSSYTTDHLLKTKDSNSITKEKLN